MKPGQSVTLRVDTFDGITRQSGEPSGRRGSAFSLFPPENATGNYVKVVQAIPGSDPAGQGPGREHMLRPGMSVEPTVDLH